MWYRRTKFNLQENEPALALMLVCCSAAAGHRWLNPWISDFIVNKVSHENCYLIKDEIGSSAHSTHLDADYCHYSSIMHSFMEGIWIRILWKIHLCGTWLCLPAEYLDRTPLIRLQTSLDCWESSYSTPARLLSKRFPLNSHGGDFALSFNTQTPPNQLVSSPGSEL